MPISRGPAPLPEILLETDVKKMGGRWKTYLYPFSLRHPRTHRALAPDALWGMYRAELMRWPTEAIYDVLTGRFRKLTFRIRGVTIKDIQWFKFKNRKELTLWREALLAQIPGKSEAFESELAPSPSAELPKAPGDELAPAKSSDPRIDPVVLLKSRPGTRFQLLGMVESTARNRQSAAAGLAIRGSMMGADAVVNLNEERLPGFSKTEHRASGMAVRAVDDEGRLELKTRWFSTQIGQIAIVMLAVACVELFVDVGAALAAAHVPANSVGASARLFLLLNVGRGLSIAGLAAGLVFGKWPQLVRPTALCFLSKAVGIVLSLLATVLNSAVIGNVLLGVIPSADKGNAAKMAIAATFGAATIFALSTLVTISLMMFYLYLGRRAWRIDQEYRGLAGKTHRPESIPPLRRWLGRLTWMAAIYYAVVYVGDAVNNLYAGASTLRTMPKSYAVIHSSTGITVSGNPQEWNNRAWRLATDADPNQRDPTEAMRLAEQAVTAEPKNADYYNTLGAARYRAGDFRGAIDALTFSSDVRRKSAHDSFFLAMAYARLGNHGEASRWYATANRWMRQNDPNNAELRRIRVEAVAVLDVADDTIRTSTQPAAKTPPGSKQAAPAGKAK